MLLVYGRSPLFFYVVHFPTIVLLGVVMRAAQGSPRDHKGVPIYVCLFVWMFVVLPVMFFATRTYGMFKGKTGPNSLWRFF